MNFFDAFFSSNAVMLITAKQLWLWCTPMTAASFA
jgi:hypothetical protein